jgi:hypothetical protein
MKKKKIQKKTKFMHVQFSDTSALDDIWDAEKEFAELVTEHWEMIEDNPIIHAKAVKTAIKLRELKSILITTKKVPQRIN